MNPAEIEETVKCHVQAQLDESGIDAVIVDAAVAGSRCRGLEQEGSDLDVVVELSTNEREDALFDMLNESGLHIGGVKVDINPITAQRTGSLETYLPQVEDYLEGVREARERDLAASISREENQKETKESLFPEQAETEVTLTVAECGEFHNLGEFMRISLLWRKLSQSGNRYRRSVCTVSPQSASISIHRERRRLRMWGLTF